MGSDPHQVDERIEALGRLEPPYGGGKLVTRRFGQETPGERVELGVQDLVGRPFFNVGQRERALRDHCLVALEARFDAAVAHTGCFLMLVWFRPSGAASLPAGSLNSPGLPSVCFQIPNIPS